MKLKKYEKNPIIAPNPANAWENLVTCNPGVIYDDGRFYMLYRAAGDDGGAGAPRSAGSSVHTRCGRPHHHEDGDGEEGGRGRRRERQPVAGSRQRRSRESRPYARQTPPDDGADGGDTGEREHVEHREHRSSFPGRLGPTVLGRGIPARILSTGRARAAQNPRRRYGLIRTGVPAGSWASRSVAGPSR